MKTIKFSHDWNSKITGPNKVFTTIRKFTEEKYKYYEESNGQIFKVKLKDYEIDAKLITIWVTAFVLVPEPILFTDTGITDLKANIKLFHNFGIDENDRVMVLVFEKTQTGKQEEIGYKYKPCTTMY